MCIPDSEARRCAGTEDLAEARISFWVYVRGREALRGKVETQGSCGEQTLRTGAGSANLVLLLGATGKPHE